MSNTFPESKRSQKGFSPEEPFIFNGKYTSLRQQDEEGIVFVEKTNHLEGRIKPKLVTTYEAFLEDANYKRVRTLVITKDCYDELRQMYRYVVEDDGITVERVEDEAIEAAGS